MNIIVYHICNVISYVICVLLWLGTQRLPSTYYKEIWMSPKMKVLPSGTLSHTLDLENFPVTHFMSHVFSPYHSTEMDAQCDKLSNCWSKLTILSTVNLQPVIVYHTEPAPCIEHVVHMCMKQRVVSVSYTHLTLPTNREV